ncbi:myosin-4-like isoform X1 [Ylistrum balloti]|uniref:myosin-4-like isoform X1 n=1 Tax=Ylistrum balloti TaxID=509963 RepID=UPI002905D220|nr:myosin-4-like isoform X1 [Ylistrum balloti]XP_060080356.1 myosin-4-like isoform X1 [Ylistrum balloti]XP_060080357.1 myosin-4-like isoform X1 [Ylistrum balloti]
MATNQKEWTDWVGELFPPAVDVTVKDLLGEKTPEEETVIKARIKHVSAFNPEAIRQVYERVHLMSVMDEEMKSQQRLKTEKQATTVSSDGETSKEKPQKKTVEVELDNSCIWDSEEISILREAFKSVKEENVRLTGRNKELEKRNLYLETRMGKLSGEVETKAVKITDINKANSRMKIHCEKLQDELDHANARLTAMEEIFSEISAEKSAMVKEVHELRVQRDKDRMDKGRLELNLESVQNAAESEKLAAEESVKIQCQIEIMELQKRVAELTADLANERRVHGVTKRGLDHLRQHFASLPLSNIIPPNSVRTDQVSKFKY